MRHNSSVHVAVGHCSWPEKYYSEELTADVGETVEHSCADTCLWHCVHREMIDNCIVDTYMRDALHVIAVLSRLRSARSAITVTKFCQTAATTCKASFISIIYAIIVYIITRWTQCHKQWPTAACRPTELPFDKFSYVLHYNMTCACWGHKINKIITMECKFQKLNLFVRNSKWVERPFMICQL